jgi:hypothetical protein
MKFVFIFNKIEHKKSVKEKKGLRERRGFGNDVIASMMNDSEFKPEKKNKAKLVKLEVKNDPKLSDQVARQRNDNEWNRMQRQKQYIDSINTTGGSKSINNIIGNVSNEMLRAIEAFTFFYSNIYKTSPPSISSNSSIPYDVVSLAKTYAIYVIEIGKAEPSQNELFEYTGITQSTWSRNFNKIEFWTKVSEFIERIWNTNKVVTDHIERLKNKKISNKEKGKDELSEIKRENYDSDEGLAENTILLNAEISLYDKFDKERLIKEILKMQPLSKRKDLEIESEGDLRRVVAILKLK